MLKYYFTAYFEDGSSYLQNPQDISTIDSQRSCFYDVIQFQKEKTLIGFELSDTVNKYYVDLLKGGIKINENAFIPAPEGLSDFRVIYFRRVTAHFANMMQLGTHIQYHVGWQANNAGGGNVQQEIELI